MTRFLEHMHQRCNARSVHAALKNPLKPYVRSRAFAENRTPGNFWSESQSHSCAVRVSISGGQALERCGCVKVSMRRPRWGAIGWGAMGWGAMGWGAMGWGAMGSLSIYSTIKP